MITLDMLKKPCPIPVIEAKKALAKATPGESVSIRVDNDVARQNLEKMAHGMGYEFTYQADEQDTILVTITVAATRQQEAKDHGGLVVAIGRECMGETSEELGKSLMKSFIYSLTELDTPPEYILLYNGGIFFALKGAGTVDDLSTLRDKGCQILSCGACLNYFDKTDELAVGQITNMYAIASAMSQAKKLINL